MNFLDAVISEKGGNLIAKVGEHELVIPAAKAKALKDGGYVGKTVVLGIRPVSYTHLDVYKRQHHL